MPQTGSNKTVGRTLLRQVTACCAVALSSASVMPFAAQTEPHIPPTTG